LKRDKTNSRWADKGWDKRDAKSRAGWRQIRAFVKERDKGLCQPCRKRGHITVGSECDHIVPDFEGGPTEEGNLQMICSECHADKTAQEAARARGYKVKRRTGPDGWPE
jgi:5-methylcytosine-specific restriction enzyme A